MQRTVLATTAVLVASAAPPLAAQEPRQQDRPAVTVPAYTDQQRWNRAGSHIVNFLISGIAYAKTRGETAEDYGRFVGELFAPSWGPPNTGYAVRAARGILFNFAAFPGSEASIVSASDTSATVRFRRSHVQQFGPQRQAFGVTLDEYDRAMAAIHERIASRLGLRSEVRVDGEWTVITVHGRGTAAVTGFPRATYAVGIPQGDTARAAASPWEVTYGPDGRYTVRHNGEVVVEGVYEVRLDELTLRDETGARACSVPATYRWTVNASGHLVVGRLADTCEGRAQFLTTGPLRRK